MTVYVDDAAIPFRGRICFHMTADSLAELHRFAQQLELSPRWFHRGARHPHYDVDEATRARALAAGAQAVDRRTLVRLALMLRRELEGDGAPQNW